MMKKLVRFVIAAVIIPAMLLFFFSTLLYESLTDEPDYQFHKRFFATYFRWLAFRN